MQPPLMTFLATIPLFIVVSVISRWSNIISAATRVFMLEQGYIGALCAALLRLLIFS
jgi:hypothetical protein